MKKQVFKPYVLNEEEQTVEFAIKSGADVPLAVKKAGFDEKALDNNYNIVVMGNRSLAGPAIVNIEITYRGLKTAKRPVQKTYNCPVEWNEKLEQRTVSISLLKKQIQEVIKIAIAKQRQPK